MITTAKGITSSYAPMGAMIASDRVAEPFMQGNTSFTHGLTFAGHPVSSAVALANIDAMEPEGVLENVRTNQALLRSKLESLRTCRSSATSAAPASSTRSSSCKNKETDEQLTEEQSETLLRGFLSGELYRRGLICRADDRGDPVIQLSPPLIAGPEQFDEIVETLHPMLERAGELMRANG